MDKISIIVPFYNVEKYAPKCIESIINQTYTNLEIILVDDGSPDTCGKICDDYALKDGRIKVIHKKNAGLSDARNVGIKEATGKYIGFVDGDDYIEKDMYKYLYNLIKENNADISICGVEEVYEDGSIQDEKAKESIEILSKEDAIKELLLDKKVRSHAWDKLYKRELFENIEYPYGRKMEDIATTYKLFDLSNKIVIGEEIKYYYLQRNNGIMGSKSTKMWVDYYELALERYNDLKITYPQMLENNIALMNIIIDLYGQPNEELKEYLKKNKIKKEYNKIYSTKALKYNLKRNDKIKMILMRVSGNLYRKIYKKYMLNKKR